MPNLKHDPRNPSDILGQPIAEGDVVAWGTNYGVSPALAISKIKKIRFIKKVSGKNKEVPQFMADDYQLQLQVIKTTGITPDYRNKNSGAVISRYRLAQWIEDGQTTQDEWEYKPSTIKLVKNIVKLNMTEQEARDAATNYPE